jgi:hypothetical protein
MTALEAMASVNPEMVYPCVEDKNNYKSLPRWRSLFPTVAAQKARAEGGARDVSDWYAGGTALVTVLLALYDSGALGIR